MRIDQAFPSDWMKAGDLGGRSFVLVMGRVEIEDLGGQDRKPVLHFQNAQKGLVLNKINASTLEVLYGPETDNWFGHQVEVYPDTTMFQGRPTPCIRVRRPQGQTPQQTHTPAPLPAGAAALATTLPPTDNPGPVEQGLTREMGTGPAPGPANPEKYDDDPDSIPF